MIFLADIALVLASLVWLVLIHWAYFDSPKSAGDAKLGQLVSTLLATLVFVACLAVLFSIAWLSDRRHSVAPDGGVALPLLASGIHLLFLAMLIPAGLIDRSDLPWTWRPYRRPIGLLLSGATLVYGVVLLHAHVDSTALRGLTQIARFLVAFETLAMAILAGEMLVITRSRSLDRLREHREREAQIDQETLQRVRALDVDTDLAELIGYLDRFQNPVIRKAAQERLSDSQDWRARVPELLERREGLTLIPWLAAESHERVGRLEEPLQRQVELVTSEVLERVTTNRHLMEWGLDDLRIADLLTVLGSYPDSQGKLHQAVQKLREAMESPDTVVDRKVIFPDLQLIHVWLASRKPPL